MTTAPPKQPSEHVRLDRTAPGLAELVLDRPDKRNALTPAMLADLARLARAAAEDDETGALLLRGEGRSFCAGFDLTICRDDPAVLSELLRGLDAAIAALRSVRTPVVVAAQGAALAGGCALLAAADLVVSHETCRIGYPVVRIGVSPAVSAPTLVPRVGPGAARARLLDPGLTDGARAQRMGLVTHLVESAEDVTPRAQIVALELSRKPRRAVRTTREWLREVEDGVGDAGAGGLETSRGLVGSEEQRALLTRALER